MFEYVWEGDIVVVTESSQLAGAQGIVSFEFTLAFLLGILIFSIVVIPITFKIMIHLL